MQQEKTFLSRHELLRQCLSFAGVSLISLISELDSYFLVRYLLVTKWHITQNANWFVFQNYGEAEGGLGLFIAFLVSTTLAQIVAFILNRKKTFHSVSNLARSAAMYAVMVIIIIFVNASINGKVYTCAVQYLLQNQYAPNRAEFWAGILSKLAGGVFSGSITFIMSKFVIMRK